MTYDYWQGVDVELRNKLIPQIVAALREAVPDATHAVIWVNDAETDAPYLYAGIVLNAEGERVAGENLSAPEHQAINALVDAETKASWDGIPLGLDLVRGVEVEDEDIFSLEKN